MIRKRITRARLFWGGLIFLTTTAFSSWYVWHWEFSPPYLEIDFLSLNRGHGVFIRLPDKHAILIDAGQSGDIIRQLSGLLPFYRRSIDSIFVTSAELKSVGGLTDVLNRYSIGQIYMPKAIDLSIEAGTSTALDAAVSLANEKNIPIHQLSAGNSIELEKEKIGGSEKSAANLPSVSLETLFPDDAFKLSNGSSAQLVLELSYGKTSIIFAGDASKTIQNFLIKNIATSSIDILEYSNSGGAGNISEKFIEKLGPKNIVIKSNGIILNPKSNKPQFTVHSYASKLEDSVTSSVTFFSDRDKIWQAN
jgi:competence protein ComEC